MAARGTGGKADVEAERNDVRRPLTLYAAPTPRWSQLRSPRLVEFGRLAVRPYAPRPSLAWRIVPGCEPHAAPIALVEAARCGEPAEAARCGELAL
jgi:hypothetical protein